MKKSLLLVMLLVSLPAILFSQNRENSRVKAKFIDKQKIPQVVLEAAEFKEFEPHRSVQVKSFEREQKAIQKGLKYVEGEYIVTLKDELFPYYLRRSEGQRKQLLSEDGLALQEFVETMVEDLGGELLYVYEESSPAFAASLSPKAVRRLERDPMVRNVGKNLILNSTNWGLDVLASTHVKEKYVPPYTGVGSHVYVLDSGLNVNHEEFVGRIGTGQSFYPSDMNLNSYDDDGDGLRDWYLEWNVFLGRWDLKFGGDPDVDNDGILNENDPDDDNGHGTHVAAIASGNRGGVAFQSTIHPVKVLNSAGSGSLLKIRNGVEWVLSEVNRSDVDNRPAVVNMSLGADLRDPNVNSNDVLSLKDAIDDLVNANVPVVVAAGNAFADASNFIPASFDSVICVGATKFSGFGPYQEFDSAYSNYGSDVDILAPGTEVRSAWIGSSNSYETLSGTSMASPQVAGVVAQILQSDPDATSLEVKQALLGSGHNGRVWRATRNFGAPADTVNSVPIVSTLGWGPQPPPADPIVEIDSNGLVRFRWTNLLAGGEHGYRIQRSTDGSNWNHVTDTYADVEEYTTTIANANQQVYRIASFSRLTEGYPWAEFDSLSQVSSFSTPASPSNFNHSPNFSYNPYIGLLLTQINLSWSDNSNNETGFRIYRRNGSGSWFALGTVGANVTSFSDNSVSNCSSYTYRVVAYNAQGESNYVERPASYCEYAAPVY